MTKLKDLLLQLLNSLGIDIKAGTALASAVKETIDLIDSTQLKSLNINKITIDPTLLQAFPLDFSDELIATEMDEDMYQKYLLICGK